MLSNDVTENANAFISGRRINFFTPHHKLVVTFSVLRQPMQAQSYCLWVHPPALSLGLGLPDFWVWCLDTWKLKSQIIQTDPSLLQANRWGAGAGSLSWWWFECLLLPGELPGAGLGAKVILQHFWEPHSLPVFLINFSDLEALLKYTCICTVFLLDFGLKRKIWLGSFVTFLPPVLRLPLAAFSLLSSVHERGWFFCFGQYVYIFAFLSKRWERGMRHHIVINLIYWHFYAAKKTPWK